MPVRRKVFRIEEMSIVRCSGRPNGRAVDIASIDARRPRPAAREADAINHAIARTKQEIAALQMDGSGGLMTGRALRELAALADSAEAATQRILAAAEEIDDAANTLSALIKQAQPRALAHDIRDQVVRIFEACNFHDLAGQRIATVVTALSSVEAHNARMMEIWGGIETFTDATPIGAAERERNEVSTSGPKLDGDAGHASQAEIDAMFEKFENERIANSE